MSNVDSARLRVMLEGLFKDSGLEIGDDDLDKVAGLYRHFAANRARLAAAELGEVEPATVFSVDAGTSGRDHDRG